MSELFRAGDKVVCVFDDGLFDSEIVKGGRYVVSCYGEDGLVELEGFDHNMGFYEYRFKLVAQ